MENYRELIEKITKIVLQELKKELEEPQIPIGVSNRHLHVSREDLDLLFGEGYELTKLKDLRQPGQYAAKETVTVRGPKGELTRVRILGPIRSKTQLEISATDSFTLGITPVVRESGKTEDTPGFELIGPKGSVQKSSGAILALRHIHLSVEAARKLGVRDKEFVSVEIGGKRKVVFQEVLIRVSENYVPEMHLDTDEANACLAQNGDLVKILKEKKEKKSNEPIESSYDLTDRSAKKEYERNVREVHQKVISMQTVLENRGCDLLIVPKNSIITGLAAEEAGRYGMKIERRR